MRAPAINPRATLCPTCGRVYSSATSKAECPVDAAKRREQERAEKSLGIDRPQSTGLSPNDNETWENKSGPRGAINTPEGLTRISELSRKGLT